MKKLISSLLYLIVLNLLINERSFCKEFSSRELIQKQEESRKLQDWSALVKLETQKSGSRKEKTFRFWRKIQDKTALFSTLTRFIEPAEIRDEAILFLEHDGGKNEVLLYLPHYKKTRRVESQQQRGSFMGSDFSYSDLTSLHAEDFLYGEHQRVPCPREEKFSCWTFEMTPAHSEILERTGYTRLKVWIHPVHFLSVKTDYQNEKGEWFKSGEIQRVQKVASGPEGDKYLPFEIKIEDKVRQSSTQMVFEEVRVNQFIKSALFNPQNFGNTR